MLHDIRIAIRRLRKTPGFSIVTVLTLAIGIGATTSIFSLVNALLLKPLPYPQPDRLVEIATGWEGQEQAWISPAEYLDYLARVKTLSPLGVYATSEANLTSTDNAPERVSAAYVSWGVLPALGVQPSAGRVFARAEDVPGSGVVMLAEGLWQRRLGGRPVLGEKIMVDGEPRTIIGIMPRSFRLPSALDGGEPSQLFIPLAIDPATTERGSHFLRGVGRLAEGERPSAAAAELERVGAGFVRQFPDDYPTEMRFRVTTLSLHDAVLGSVRRFALILFGAVLLVLLITIANAMNLLIVRADTRRKDLAIRSAIGAQRRDLIRGFLSESLVLSIAGGLGGLAVTEVAIRWLPRVIPQEVPRAGAIEIDWTVLLCALLTVAVSSLLIGVVPALRANRAELEQTLRSEGGGTTTGGGRTMMRNTVVAIEIALAVVLSLGAGLLLRSIAALYRVDPGFRTERVLSFALLLPDGTYDEDRKIVSFYRNLSERLSAIPGIESAGAATSLPLAEPLGDLNFRIDGKPMPEGEVSPRADWQAVTPGYFDTMGMQVLRGRGILPRDDENAPGVIVMNEATATKYWPKGDAIGTRLKLGGGAGPGWVTIVGIVRNIRHQSIASLPKPEMYIPHAQFRFWHGGGAASSMSVVLRTRGNPNGVIGEVRRVVGELDAALPVSAIRTLDQVKAASLAQSRFLALLFSSFSLVALVLSAIGIYGLLAFLVMQRRREIGIRIALGAERRSVLALVLRQAVQVTVPGVLAGMVMAFLSTRLLASLLYGVLPGDPFTFTVVPLTLAGVALLASLMPAVRAARTDATLVLREE